MSSETCRLYVGVDRAISLAIHTNVVLVSTKYGFFLKLPDINERNHDYTTRNIRSFIFSEGRGSSKC